MRTLSTSNQARWKDCFASSAKVGHTLRCNGEEKVQVFTENRELVPAGILAPTVAPTIADAGGGALAAGYVVYRYVYASSLYPNVEAVTTAGGETWPKSNPSPASAPFLVVVSHSNAVTVTKTTASGVDNILIYRTAIKATSAEAVALGDAGELFYVGVIGNGGTTGTTTFSDNITAAQEQLELDNYVAPQFWVCCYEDPYWWGIGNPDLIVSVTLANSTAITAAARTFFAGRQNQLVTFDGISTGGFDGRGTYYFLYLSDSVANVSTTPDGSASVVAATGTTMMRVRGYAGTLYRSKPRNPLAWGFTEIQAGAGGSVIRVPQQYAFPMGGHACAIAVLPDARLLKIDLENPSACYTLNLNLAGQNGFEQSKRTLDKRYVCSSHFAQFVTRLPSGETVLTGIDAGNKSLVKASASNQGDFGDEAFRTLFALRTDLDNPRLYHGAYDPGTELSCWWIKVGGGAGSAIVDIDTCICFHGPSGQWSILRDFDVTASASVFDPVTLSTLTLIGTRQGQIAKAFETDNSFPDNDAVIRTVTALELQTLERYHFHFTLGALEGDYIDVPAPPSYNRVWFHYLTSPTTVPPATPALGTITRVDLTGTLNAATVAQTSTALIAAGLSYGTSGDVYIKQASGGPVGILPSIGTYSRDAAAYLVVHLEGSNASNVTVTPTPPISSVPRWMMLGDPTAQADQWVRVTSEPLVDGMLVIELAVVRSGESALFVTGLSSIGTGGGAYMGAVNCEARTYFQPNQTNGSQLRELWNSFRNVGGDTLFYRFYPEFDTAMLGAAIVPVQVTRPEDGLGSVNWVARNIPAALTPQMGLRLVERGYGAFEVLGLNLKLAKT